MKHVKSNLWPGEPKEASKMEHKALVVGIVYLNSFLFIRVQQVDFLEDKFFECESE